MTLASDDTVSPDHSLAPRDAAGAILLERGRKALPAGSRAARRDDDLHLRRDWEFFRWQESGAVG